MGGAFAARRRRRSCYQVPSYSYTVLLPLHLSYPAAAKIMKSIRRFSFAVDT